MGAELVLMYNMIVNVDEWAYAHQFGPQLAVPKVGRLGVLTTRQARRSGVYLLHFANGDTYVGRSVDVIGRLADHRRSHPDLIGVRLRWLAQSLIVSVERELIRSAEGAGLPLRNVDEMSSVLGDTPFNERLPAALQEEWLRSPATVNAADPTAREISPVRAYEARFQQLKGIPLAPRVTALLRSYLLNTVPLPVRTERDYWVLTCLPRSNANWPRLAAVSIGRMETLVVGEWGGFVNLASDRLGDLRALRRRHRDVHVETSDYRDAGVLQVRLSTTSVEALATLVEDADVAGAASVLNLRLMRKGRTFYGRFHCPQLAGAVLAG